MTHNEKIEQDLALRREQPGMQCITLAFQLVHITGNDALQQLFCINTRNADNPTVRQKGTPQISHCVRPFLQPCLQ